MPTIARAPLIDTARVSPVVKKLFHFCLMIALPCFSIALATRVLWDNFGVDQMTVRVMVRDADGIESGRTVLKFKGVPVGQVHELEIVGDRARVSISVPKRFAGLFNKGARISLVRPKVGWTGLSGLSALRSGAYFVVQSSPAANSRDAATTLDFVEYEKNETDESPAFAGPDFRLRARDIGALGVGSPVLFRGVRVGEIVATGVSARYDAAVLSIRVFEKYRKIVRTNSLFWRIQAAHADFSLFGGGSFSISSLESAMRGGVQFATPEAAGDTAGAGREYDLLDRPPASHENWRPVF